MTPQIPFMREESLDKAPTEVCATSDSWGADGTDGKKGPLVHGPFASTETEFNLLAAFFDFPLSLLLRFAGFMRTQTEILQGAADTVACGQAGQDSALRNRRKSIT